MEQQEILEQLRTDNTTHQYLLLQHQVLLLTEEMREMRAIFDANMQAVKTALESLAAGLVDEDEEDE